MTPGQALIAALGDLYHQSWRLLVLNAGLSLLLVPLLVAALWVPVLLVAAALLAGPLVLALMHCAVTLVTTDELRLRCAADGLRLHWRRGLALGAVVGLVAGLGVVAVVVYGRAELWPLAILALYLLLCFCGFLLVLLPVTVAERSLAPTVVVRDAALVVLRRPLQVAVLGVALLTINLLGAAAALLPLLTLTVSYSFVAAARFVLPLRPVEA